VHGPISSELIGSPDMVLEVVSTSSVQKDTVILPELYWKAGVREHWLVDPRGEEVIFDIFKRGEKGFERVKGRGWLKSAVFGKSFRLTMRIDDTDLPVFTLEVR
jgi:Uma2 family endonuclease